MIVRLIKLCGGDDILFYKVGEYKGYFFVYDTEDNSCELISNSSLRKSGLKIERFISNKCNYHKILAVYNFKEVNGIFTLPLFDYILYMMLDTGDMYKVTFKLDIIMIKYSNLTDRYLELFVESLNENYGYMDEYVPFLRVKRINCKSTGIGTNKINVLDFDGSVFEGLSFHKNSGVPVKTFADGLFIPVQMLDYTVHLVRNGNEKMIFDAYNGIFSDKLVLKVSYGLRFSSLKPVVGTIKIL